MEVLMTIGLVIAVVIIFIGIIRVIFAPYTGFINLLLEMMLLDWLGDLFVGVISAIGDIWSDD